MSEIISSSNLSLFNRIYECTYSECKDESLANYIADICCDKNTNQSDDLLQTMSTIFKSSYPNMTETRRMNFIYKLLDLIEQDEKQPVDKFENDDDIDAAENIERDGECKLCGCKQRITIHHLIPKLILKRMKNSGKDRVDVSKYLVEVCRPCHNELHRLWPHSELAKDLSTVDMILDAPEIQPYLNWKRKRERTE